MEKITAVISYCTNDYRFLGKCIEEARHFSEQIIVPVCDHFFNGTAENRELLHWTYAQHPDVLFLEFPYSNQLYPSYIRYCPDDKEWTGHWNNLARILGFYYAKSEWILFLDTDEIVDGKRFLKADLSGFDAARVACYYYVLKPNIRATKVQDLTLLVRRKVLEPKFFYQKDERYGIFQYIQKRKLGLRGADGRPLIHHYSWVRPLKECQKKVTTWSHRLDKDWATVVKELFQGKLSALFGVDLDFEEVKDVYFDPLAVAIPSGQAPPFANVKKVTHRDFLRLELEHETV